jgi:hypothetical protein
MQCAWKLPTLREGAQTLLTLMLWNVDERRGRMRGSNERVSELGEDGVSRTERTDIPATHVHIPVG